jgi:glucose-1-phosphate adenylyltransferase
VLVLAGGAGGRLELLTDHRAKPSVPYAGSFRLIDFPLSNCLHAGMSDVWVVAQFHPASLADHLANGRPWDLDRTHGGLLVLPPHLGTEREGWHQGTADALWREAPLIREFAPDALVVVSADAVYTCDYAQLVDEHLSGGATVTMVTTRVAAADAGRYGVVRVGDGGRVIDYAYKPDEPATDVVTNEVFVFTPSVALDLLDELAGQVGDDGLGDLGHALLPRLVGDGAAREHRFTGYWRDVGTVDAYWSSHLDLLADDPPVRLDDPAWPIRTRLAAQVPARVAAGAHIAESLLSPGVTVAGRVERCVLSPGVVVEPGGTVRDSVLLHGTVVRSDASVERAVTDADARIGRGARVGGGDAVTLLATRSVVADGSTVPAGARVAGG